jgi:hypothetical protein
MPKLKPKDTKPSKIGLTFLEALNSEAVKRDEREKARKYQSYKVQQRKPPPLLIRKPG